MPVDARSSLWSHHRPVARRGRSLTDCRCGRTKSRHGAFSLSSSVKEETPMKTFILILTLALAIGLTGPVFAGDVTTAKTQVDCQKAGGMWDAKTNTCSGKKM